MTIRIVALLMLLVAVVAPAKSGSGEVSDQALQAILKSVSRALNFSQGDSRGFNQAKADFTPQAWADFLKHMSGFLDDQGAPTFTQKFETAGSAVVVSSDGDRVRLKIPGTLIQTQGGSRTTYRLRVEVEAAGNPPRIQRLEQITCTGKAAAANCM
jgi:hypothetical protein